jgi:8-oxo-dGTP diphosphatase
MKTIDAVCGVLIKPNGGMLYCQRKKPPYQGYWEFPGGKIERFELPEMAIRREILEEIGVLARVVLPWRGLTHCDRDSTVFLRVFRVLSWESSPYAAEAQPMAWLDPFETPEPLLPANRLFLKQLWLPPYCAFTAVEDYGLNGFLERLRYVLQKGLKLIVLREKNLGINDVKKAYTHIAEVVAHSKAKLLLSSFHLDLLCPKTKLPDGLAGIHYTASDLKGLQKRPPWLAGASCHNVAELQHAYSLGLDFAVLSAVEKTSSHPDTVPLGWKDFSNLTQGFPSFPVYALGGLDWQDLHWAVMHGAQGVAFRRAAWV